MGMHFSSVQHFCDIGNSTAGIKQPGLDILKPAPALIILPVGHVKILRHYDKYKSINAALQ